MNALKFLFPYRRGITPVELTFGAALLGFAFVGYTGHFPGFFAEDFRVKNHSMDLDTFTKAVAQGTRTGRGADTSNLVLKSSESHVNDPGTSGGSANHRKKRNDVGLDELNGPVE